MDCCGPVVQSKFYKAKSQRWEQSREVGTTWNKIMTNQQGYKVSHLGNIDSKENRSRSKDAGK